MRTIFPSLRRGFGRQTTGARPPEVWRAIPITAPIFSLLIRVALVAPATSPLHALETEPAVVREIRSQCSLIDKKLDTMRRVTLDEGCQGHSCGGEFAWVNPDGVVQKISGKVRGEGGANSNESGELEWLYYFDERARPHFSFDARRSFKERELTRQHESRVYFKDNKLVAIKDGQHWVSPSDPSWPRREAEQNSGMNSKLAEINRLLKKGRQEDATTSTQ
jgi:hypothetical protein